MDLRAVERLTLTGRAWAGYVLAMVAFALQPAGPLASVIAGALAATGLGWLSRRGVVSPTCPGSL